MLKSQTLQVGLQTCIDKQQVYCMVTDHLIWTPGCIYSAEAMSDAKIVFALVEDVVKRVGLHQNQA